MERASSYLDEGPLQQCHLSVTLVTYVKNKIQTILSTLYILPDDFNYNNYILLTTA